MPAPDFLENVETAWLKVIQDNAILAVYNWERWDSDKQLELPRGRVNLQARTDPDETPYQRVETSFVFEGRPKKQKLSVIMNELKTLLQTLEADDLYVASGNTVKFIGKAVSINENRQVQGGLRVWTLSFAVYALSMVTP